MCHMAIGRAWVHNKKKMNRQSNWDSYFDIGPFPTSVFLSNTSLESGNRKIKMGQPKAFGTVQFQ